MKIAASAPAGRDLRRARANRRQFLAVVVKAVPLVKRVLLVHHVARLQCKSTLTD
jgi:hypothetical protein